jgi:hypothetical protein
MDVTKSDYYFKRITPELYHDLLIISKSAFGFEPGIDYYINKNNTSKFGIPDLGFIAYYKDGTPAAFYGVYSCPLIFNKERFHAAQSGDTMTHKDHMGKGLFTLLAQKTYELAKELGVDFVFGFPNNNSFPGFQKKLDWKFKEQLKEYRLKVATIPLCKLVKRIGILKPLYNLYTRFVIFIFCQKGKTFPNSIIEERVGGVERTDEFYQYKFKFDNFILNLNGINIWMKLDGFLFLGDIERKSNCDYNKLMKKIKRLSFFLGVDTIILQTSPDTFLDNQFKKHFSSTNEYFVGFRDLNIEVKPENFKFVFGDVDTF